jgi:hypothetical protein
MLAIFIVVSFIRFDFNVANWDSLGRVFFVFFSVLFAGFASAIQETK